MPPGGLASISREDVRPGDRDEISLGDQGEIAAHRAQHAGPPRARSPPAVGVGVRVSEGQGQGQGQR